MFKADLILELNEDIKTKKGFEELYVKYVSKLCRIAYNQVQDKSVTESIVQNVYASIWERRYTLQIEGPIENYLVRAVKLASLDYIRTQINHRKHLECSLSEFCGSSHCTEDQVNFNELVLRVNQLVDQLPCQCREVYKLSRERGLSNKQIASSLLIAEKTVEAHLTKALRHLRSQLLEA